MIRRTLAFLLLAWLTGFIWFAIALPRPLDGAKSDGVIVLTGGEGRISRGLEVIERGWAKNLLVSGVDGEVKPSEFAAEYKVSPETMRCCIVLGYESKDTRSNALEAARWMAAQDMKSIRLVTSDWHMRRAIHEFERLKPDGLTILPDAVATQPSLRILFLEYNKLLARRAAVLWGS